MSQPIAVAFSGGLDTSWLVARFVEEGHDVTAIAVNCGAWDDEGAEKLVAHARWLGAVDAVVLEGREALFDDHLAWLIRGNVLRGATYPLSVGVERVVQARLFAAEAGRRGITTLVHGSTGAGNDQIRFDTALRTEAPGTTVLAPIRDEARTREETTAWLAARGKHPLHKDTAVSINSGLWGTTAGGRETHDAWLAPTEASYTTTTSPALAPTDGHTFVLSFEDGLPVAIDGGEIRGWRALDAIAHLGAAHGVGRGVHLGDTILGIKGRVAFEAPAAAIVLPAHRELEKLVLTGPQRFWKDHLADLYGQLVHEARYHDPLGRDLEAFLGSSQHRVTGDVRVHLRQGTVAITGVRSPWSIMDVQQTAYGESTSLWSGADARGFARIHGTSQWLAARASQRAQGEK